MKHIRRPGHPNGSARRLLRNSNGPAYRKPLRSWPLESATCPPVEALALPWPSESESDVCPPVAALALALPWPAESRLVALERLVDSRSLRLDLLVELSFVCCIFLRPDERRQFLRPAPHY